MIRLTSIEQLYYFDSTPQFPNRITGRLLFSETIDEEKAREACFWLSRRHSILNWRIRQQNRQLVWDDADSRFEESKFISNEGKFHQPDQERNEALSWFHFQDLDGPPTENPHILNMLGQDHFFEPCMVVRRWNDSAGLPFSEVWFSIPHSFCDGAGGVLVANDWVQIYDNLMNGAAALDGLLRLDRDRLKYRNCLGLSKWKYLKYLPFQTIGLFGAFKFIFRKSARFENRHSNQNEKGDQTTASADLAPASIGCWLEPKTLAKLESLVESQGHNLNARFLGTVFHTLHQWRMKNDPQADSAEWLRVILPMNLREIEDRRMEAANKSSLVQIDRRGSSDPADAEFYRSIQNEIGVIHKYKLDRMFLIMIRVISRIPFLLKRVATNQKHRGMAIFTNLGQPYKRLEKLAAREDRLIPMEVDFLAPLRNGTPFNFAVCRFQDRLRITLHYDPAAVSQSQASNILRVYKDTLCGVVEGN